MKVYYSSDYYAPFCDIIEAVKLAQQEILLKDGASPLWKGANACNGKFHGHRTFLKRDDGGLELIQLNEWFKRLDFRYDKNINKLRKDFGLVTCFATFEKYYDYLPEIVIEDGFLVESYVHRYLGIIIKWELKDNNLTNIDRHFTSTYMGNNE
jgi:hypothetical protein